MRGKSWFRAAFAAVILLSVFSGCATVPLAPPELDASAKQFAVPAGLSRIYVYRNEGIGFAVRMEVLVDGKLIGTTQGHQYLYADVPAGKHTITSMAENTGTLDVVTETGRPTFVWQEVKMGLLYARCKLQQVDDATGRKGVLECKLTQLQP